MKTITLISSFHIIHGKCNPQELYKIIEQIRPEVIFEELPDDVFNLIYSPFHEPQSLEAIAIKQYIKSYPIQHFPVDNHPVHEDELFNGAEFVWNNSAEYGELWNMNMKRMGESGYLYLNSSECISMLDKIAEIESSVLTESGQLDQLEILKKEKLLHSTREHEMLNTIYKYASMLSFEHAVFICGVDHRKGIKDKISTFENNGDTRLNWSFFNEA